MTPLQVNILLLCLGALQGVILFLLLFKKRKTLPGYIYLAAYLIVMILQITMKLASKIWLMHTIRPLYTFSYHLPFLYGPLIYLFACSVTGYRKISGKDMFHFMPSVLAVSCMIFPGVYKFSPFLFYPLLHTFWAMMSQLVSLISYHALAFYLLRKYRDNFPSSVSVSARYRLQWLRKFITGSLIACSVIAVTICVMYYKYPHWQNIRFGFVALTIFIYWISYKVWCQPELFTVIRGNLNEPMEYAATKLVAHLPAKKYSNSGLAEDDMQRIISFLENKMRSDKPYLDPELTIDALADSISCSRHHLSQAMNEKMDKSFYDFINQYRVEEAKCLLQDESRMSHKIASIAYDAGFNSISTFNDVFKKLTGSTPSQYRKLREEKTLRKQRV